MSPEAPPYPTHLLPFPDGATKFPGIRAPVSPEPTLPLDPIGLCPSSLVVSSIHLLPLLLGVTSAGDLLGLLLLLQGYLSKDIPHSVPHRC